MAAFININLPVIVSFLLLYSLKQGSMFICIWTAVRSAFCFFFFIWGSVDEFLPSCPAYRGAVVRLKPITQDDDYCSHFYYIMFLSYIGLIVVESMLFLYSISLGYGIYNASITQITHYLVCRFITWCLEIVMLTLITIIKDESKGWYIFFLMLIVLELYGFLVVYSFLNEICEKATRRQQHCCLDAT